MFTFILIWCSISLNRSSFLMSFSAAWRMPFINIYYKVDSDNESSQFCLWESVFLLHCEVCLFPIMIDPFDSVLHFNFFTEIASLSLCFVYLYKLELLSYYYISFSLHVWWLTFVLYLDLYDCCTFRLCFFIACLLCPKIMSLKAGYASYQFSSSFCFTCQGICLLQHS